MSYYRTCRHCGAHLDPGETCDCRGSLMVEIMAMSEQCVEKAAQGVGGTQGGGAEQIA